MTMALTAKTKDAEKLLEEGKKIEEKPPALRDPSSDCQFCQNVLFEESLSN